VKVKWKQARLFGKESSQSDCNGSFSTFSKDHGRVGQSALGRLGSYPTNRVIRDLFGKGRCCCLRHIGVCLHEVHSSCSTSMGGQKASSKFEWLTDTELNGLHTHPGVVVLFRLEPHHTLRWYTRTWPCMWSSMLSSTSLLQSMRRACWSIIGAACA
jgi:hypothetical protein